MYTQANSTRWRSHATAWKKLYKMWPLLRAAWTMLELDKTARLPADSEITALIMLFLPLDEFTEYVDPEFENCSSFSCRPAQAHYVN
jgi:hypothetical protein